MRPFFLLDYISGWLPALRTAIVREVHSCQTNCKLDRTENVE